MGLFIPNEIQGYIRHVLHSIGVLIVAYGGANQEIVDIYVGLMVNLISLSWFALATYVTWKAQRQKAKIDVSNDS